MGTQAPPCLSIAQSANEPYNYQTGAVTDFKRAVTRFEPFPATPIASTHESLQRVCRHAYFRSARRSRTAVCPEGTRADDANGDSSNACADSGAGGLLP